MDTQIQKRDVIPVDDLDTFIHIVTSWHQNKVKMVQHMLEVPEGQEVEYEDKTYVLVDDVRQAFIIGVTVALSELGVLPFTSVTPQEKESTTTNEPTTH